MEKREKKQGPGVSALGTERGLRRFGVVRVSLYAGAAAALALIPTAFFDANSLCLFYNLLGVRCPGCGLTRAFSSVMHLEPVRAVEYNPLVLVLFPLLLALAAQDAWRVLLRLFRGGEKFSLLEKLLRRMGF